MRPAQNTALFGVWVRQLPRILHHLRGVEVDVDQLAIALLHPAQIDPLDDVALDLLQVLQDKTKGNRQYFSLGAGFTASSFGFNLSYLIPSGSGVNRNPLSNTIRFSLLMDLAPSDRN
jgi:hypothetical protein